MNTLGFNGRGKDIRGIGLDIDNTVYRRSEEYFADGSRRELEGSAKAIGLSFAEMLRQFMAKKKELAAQLKRKVTVTETVYALGVTKKQWSELRIEAWQPEEWISPDPEMSSLIAKLAENFSIGFGTNSPIKVAERTLRIIGILDAAPTVKIFGPENVGASKPKPKFFQSIATGLNLPPDKCIFIGDRDFSDGPPALEAGYAGAIIVPGSRDELLAIGPDLLAADWDTITRKGGV